MSILKPIRTIGTDDQLINKLQDNLINGVDQLLNLPILDGILVESIRLTTGQRTLVPHKLNRKFRGWFVTKLRPVSPVLPATPVYIWDIDFVSPELNLSTIYLSMWCDQNCTVSLWVF